MASTKLMMVAAVITLASLCVPSTMAQIRHVVGGDVGWTIPSSNTIYPNWASQQTFNVGDTLYFNFSTGAHDVAEVTQAAYGPCTTTNPISTTLTGPATLNLTTPGNHYYICTFGTHCQIGQKITINVMGSSSTTPSPTGSTTPSTPSPPPPPSSASSFSAVVPITFLAAALAFFY